MESNSVEERPVSPPDEWVSESCTQGDVDTSMSRSSRLQDKKAPRAEPEEDIDVLEPGAQHKTLPENQIISETETADATKLENQKSTRISLRTRRETQEIVTELEQVAQLSDAIKAEEESEESTEPCEDTSPPPPPPPPLSALSTEECFETEGFSSLEGEGAEWISDGEIISDPTEDRTSPNIRNIQERAQTPPLLQVDSTAEEMTGINEDVTQSNFLPDGSEPGNKMPGAAQIDSPHHSPSDRNDSDDEYSVCSPPYADESVEEEEVSSHIMPCQQQYSTEDIRSGSLKYFSVSTEKPLHAVASSPQQDELLSRSRCEPAPKGANQEVAQQVHSQDSAPLSTVAMELSNQGGATSESSGCAVRERHSRAEERTEGESEQTGGEERQKEGELERNKAGERQQGARLLDISKTQELNTVNYRFPSSQHPRMESDSCDDSQSDSGVSADFSPCSTLEGNTTISTGTPAAAPKETPIEREIRRAIEREHSLRRSRGLPSPPTTPEYVEIPLRKSVLCQSADRCQGKDRQYAGKKMEHEIHEEVRREQDLVKLGKVPGFYDKGTVRQLKERKQLFEAFQTPDESTLTVSTRSKTMSWSAASDVSTLENQDTSSQTSTIGSSHVDRNLSLIPKGPGFTEGSGCQVVIIEDNLSAKPEAEPITELDSGSPNVSSSSTGGQIQWKEPEEDKADVTSKENPFFKLRSSTSLIKVEQDIREAQEREKELHQQRISLYGGREGARGGGGGGRPDSTEGKSPMLSSSSSPNELTVPASSGGGTRPPAVSVGKFGLWPPAPTEEEKTEVLHSPRTPRQKTPLVQRWESGLVNGHHEEDD